MSEIQLDIYIPSEQDLKNWKRVQNQYAPDIQGTHDELAREQEPENKRPLSFNLRAETVRAREARESGSETAIKLARDGFISNAMYWAREYVGDIKTTHYYWEIEQSGESARLYHPQFGYADEMARNAIEDDSIPEFERKRREIEYEVGENLTKHLADAAIGETYIWMSPSPEGIENDTYGGYTMGHLYEVKEVNGKKVLAGRDVKNRLSNENHKLLLEGYAKTELFKANPTSNEILGTLIKTELGVSSRDIETTIKVLEKSQQAASDEREVEDEELKAQIFESVLSRQEYRLKRIYSQLESSTLRESLVVGDFTDWAKTIFIDSETEKLVRGKNTREEVEEFMEYAVLRFEERVSGGSCGEGFGFGDMTEQYDGTFGYIPGSVSGRFGGEIQDKYGGLEFECPNKSCRKKNKRPYGILIKQCGEGQVGGCGVSVSC